MEVTMENTNLYKRALNKWNFIKTFYFKLAIVILFNISYMCFLYIRKGELMNHVSLYFLFFSVMYLAYHILKFALMNLFINSFKNLTLEKKEIFFFSHVSFFIILLLMNVLVDLNRTFYNKDIFEDYSSFLFWLGIIFIHGIIVFNPFKKWEDRKVAELINKQEENARKWK